MPLKQLPDSAIRRRFSPEFKAKLVSASKQPGASLAAIALANGINSNLLHRWRKEYVSGYAWSDPAQRRSNRHYPDEFKRMIVAQCWQPGATATSVARANALHPNLVGTWAKKLHPARLLASSGSEPVTGAVNLLPVIVAEEEPAQPLAANRAAEQGKAVPQIAGQPPNSANPQPGQIDIELAGARITVRGAVNMQSLRAVLEALR
jgi:transposase-like protein